MIQKFMKSDILCTEHSGKLVIKLKPTAQTKKSRT